MTVSRVAAVKEMADEMNGAVQLNWASAATASKQVYNYCVFASLSIHIIFNF